MRLNASSVTGMLRWGDSPYAWNGEQDAEKLFLFF